MSLKPQTPRKRNKFLNIFRSRSSSSHPSSISTQSPVPNDPTNHQSPSEHAVPQLPAQVDQVVLGSCNIPDRPPPPVNVPVNHQKTGNSGATAIQVVKESLKIVARMSDLCTPLKTVATGLVEIFDRMDAIKDVLTESELRYEQVEKLEKILEAYQNGWLDGNHLKDRLDGLHRALEEKRVALEDKLDRPLVTRIIFSTEDSKFLAQVLREITFSIEVATFHMTLDNNREISKMSGNVAQINDNAVLDKLGHVVGAEFDHEDRPGCTHGTRVSLLSTLLEWATASDSPHVLWLNGMAGTGKTTVMETFCSLLNEKDLLGASFFCSIKSKTPRRNVSTIFPSIAKTLARNFPRFRESLIKALATFSDPLGMNLKDQYYKLITGPAEAAFREDEIIVVAIDALDECEDQEGIEKLLGTILAYKPNVPLRFFATSRPERRIREAFQQQRHLPLRLHDIEDHIVQADIELYLNDQLRRVSKLKQKYETSWPPAEIRTIVQRAGNLFVYASTIFKYITDRGDPCKRLEKISALQPFVTIIAGSIGNLYSFILSEALTDLDDEEALCIWSCLSILISTQQPLSVSTYAKLLGTDADSIRTALESLHSVMIVPDADDQYISIYHASFPDYLATRTDDMRPAHMENATRCFKFMNLELCLGISGATTSHRTNNDQPHPLFIPAHLKYTCTAWGYLVLQLIGPDNLIVEDVQQEIEGFLRIKFLYWLEALSAVRDVPYVLPLLHRLSQRVSDSQPLKPILIDFGQFTSTFMDPIRASAPHIYLSALPFASPTSLVSKLFLPEFPSLPIVHQLSENMYTPHSILRFEGHQGFVKSVAFSPDGKYIASGSGDSTIRLWNVETGEAAFKPFEGHKERVWSVVFSPNGEYIASGSSDHTIRLWNIKTGKMTVKQFEGDIVTSTTSVSFTCDGKYIIFVSQNLIIHRWNIDTDEMVLEPLPSQDKDFHVRCAAISPDGMYIACDSAQANIQLWNIKAAPATLKPLKTSLVFCLSFSPDGKYLVNSSHCTIQLWNIETGELASKPFEGHQDFVGSVMFSPDGRYIVSGSNGSTVRIWNIQTGEAALEPFTISGVASTSFSPDGKYIVFGSLDGTIRLWKFETNKVGSRPNEWHTESINSISFSPDGKYIASGSDDRTVRLWNVDTGRAALEPFEGHTSPVTSISFSPNGEYIAAGSWNMIRLWNAKTGEFEVEFAPFEGWGGQVTSITFFPDGKHIASCSSYNTAVHLWNNKTIEKISQPFSEIPEESVYSFSPDGEHIAVGLSDGSVQLGIIETGEFEATLKPLSGVHTEAHEEHMIRCITFSTDGMYIVICSHDDEIRLFQWKGQTREVALLFQGRLTTGIIGFGRAATISPDKKYIIFGSFRTVQLCTIEMDQPDSRALVSNLKHLGGHRGLVASLSFSPDGKYIASGSYDCTIRIYHNSVADRTCHDLMPARLYSSISIPLDLL